jgi:hypothetical protein
VAKGRRRQVRVAVRSPARLSQHPLTPDGLGTTVDEASRVATAITVRRPSRSESDHWSEPAGPLGVGLSGSDLSVPPGSPLTARSVAGGSACTGEAVTGAGPSAVSVVAPSVPSAARRNSRMARPSAAPVSGNLPGPITRRAMTRMMIRCAGESAPMPISRRLQRFSTTTISRSDGPAMIAEARKWISLMLDVGSDDRVECVIGASC